MSGIKLIYFNLMGRAETARLILAQAGVSYEDKRIEKEEWPALKASLPMGQLPVLEVDGKTIGQSMAIARYFFSLGLSRRQTYLLRSLNTFL